MEDGGCTPCSHYVISYVRVWGFGVFKGYRNGLIPLSTISIYLYTLGEIPLGVGLRVLASVG